MRARQKPKMCFFRSIHHPVPGDAAGGRDALVAPRARPWTEAAGGRRQGLVQGER